ncbi:MAG: NADH-quinone oxidoreductase subunit J [Chloroflexi bacterium]|nr:NADH-quinone oxidoreductase subunit J [Chloroflexota bacterium]
MLTSEFLTYVAFFAMAAVALVGAFLAVSLRNLVRSALGLILSFMGVAGIYFVLEAEFVAIVQVIIYIGAISVLILFAIMLTRGLMSGAEAAENRQWIGGAFIALFLFAVIFFVAITTNWPVVQAPVSADLIPKIGTELVGQYVLPFEAASLLLLAALIGAIVIARE